MADVRPLVWGYKFTREIARRMPVFRCVVHRFIRMSMSFPDILRTISGELAEMHPKFPNGSKAALIHETDKGSGPLDLNAPVAEYGPEDDAAIEKYTREFGEYCGLFVIQLV